MTDSGGPEEDYAVIFSPGGSGSSIPPASPAGSSLGTPGEDSPTEPPTNDPTVTQTEPVGVVESLMNSNAEKTAEIRRLCASEFRLLQSVGLDGHSLERYI